jgi:hypothetical protein
MSIKFIDSGRKKSPVTPGFRDPQGGERRATVVSLCGEGARGTVERQMVESRNY